LCGSLGCSAVRSGQDRDKCYFFNSFFYKRLLTSAEDARVPRKAFNDPAALAEAYKNIKAWTKNAKIFEKVRI
jgi:Ulp1 family protease